MTEKRLRRRRMFRGAVVAGVVALLAATPAHANWLAPGSAVLGVGHAVKRNLGEAIDLLGEALDAAMEGDVERMRKIEKEIEALPGRLVRDAFPVFKLGAAVRDAAGATGVKLKSAAERIPRLRSGVLGAMTASRERLQSVTRKIRLYYGDDDEGDVNPRVALAIDQQEDASPGSGWDDEGRSDGDETGGAGAAGNGGKTAEVLAAAETSVDDKPNWPPGKKFRDCAECPEMVVVPSGSFMMGSPSSEKGLWPVVDGPVHRVEIGERFAVGVYEVTFDEWEACVRGGGCGGYPPDDAGWGRGRRPVINVSWEDAQAYVEWLRGKTGQGYRLLSESEWEYVARAGTKTSRFWGGSETDQCRYGNGWDRALMRKFSGEAEGTEVASCDDGYARTSPVGSFGANGWGLHDVLGNVWEWVEDCMNLNYEGAPSDGSAWARGECGARMMRGASWFESPRFLRSGFRNGAPLDHRYHYLGFRIARTL